MGTARPAFSQLSPSILHSTYRPSVEDESSIQTTIHDVECTLSIVDQEVERLLVALAELDVYRKDLCTVLTRHQAVLSPIRKLPPEILAEIFLCAAGDSSVAWPASGQGGMPWLLGNICSYWRTVFLSLPKLWQEFHLKLGIGEQKGVLELAKTCLHRSGKELLTFSFEADTSEMVFAILDVLTLHSERWKDVSIDVGRLSTCLTSLSGARSRVPNLQKLHLGTSAMDTMSSRVILDTFADAPSLRQVSISRLTQPFHFLRIPWSQITCLTSKFSTFQEGEFSQILRHATNLVSFSTEGERILEVTASQPVLLPYLRKLAITNKGSYIAKSFQFLTAPNLKELHLHAITPFNPEQTVAMLARSGCKLSHLRLEASRDPDALWEENIGIVWLLAELPSLVYLDLSVLKSEDDICPRITYRLSASQPLLPNLETLVIEDNYCVSVHALTEMVASRTKYYDPIRRQKALRSVTLKLSRPAPPTFPELEKLKILVEGRGVEIVIQSL
ncbi:hypothetical protein B0H34DRAFT_799627 [Crassisporium funariophilum]|nr:hypothetical protein B0H34DRAFT_799627 [Crassisporium funariophilum]